MAGEPSEHMESRPGPAHTVHGVETSPTINGDGFDHIITAPRGDAPSSLKKGGASFDSGSPPGAGHYPHPRDTLAPWRWKAILLGGSVMAIINGKRPVMVPHLATASS